VIETGPTSELREALVEAARRMLDEPDTPLDLRKVAERIGKSRTAPYLVFGRTEDGGGLAALKLAVAARGLEELADELARARGQKGPPDGRLLGLATKYLEFAAGHPRLFRLMFGVDGSRPSEKGVSAREFAEVLWHRARLEGLLREVVTGSLGPPSEASTSQHVVATWAMLHGAALLMLDGQLEIAGYGSPPPQVAKAISDFLGGKISRDPR
jgi:hypothetical protein